MGYAVLCVYVYCEPLWVDPALWVLTLHWLLPHCVTLGKSSILSFWHR